MERKGDRLIFNETEQDLGGVPPEERTTAALHLQDLVALKLHDVSDRVTELHTSPIRGDRRELDELEPRMEVLSGLWHDLDTVANPSPYNTAAVEDYANRSTGFGQPRGH